MQFAFAILVCAAFFGASTSQDVLPNSFRFVTTVDGKSFFTESTWMNWTAAGRACEDFGLKLASITSQTQLDALTEVQSEEFAGHYWTSGRDSYSIYQFTWDGTQEEVSTSFANFNFRSRKDNYNTCLAFVSFPVNSTTGSLFDRSSYFTHYSCASISPVLCETR